jgi:hypothetical protein
MITSTWDKFLAKIRAIVIVSTLTILAKKRTGEPPYLSTTIVRVAFVFTQFNWLKWQIGLSQLSPRPFNALSLIKRHRSFNIEHKTLATMSQIRAIAHAINLVINIVKLLTHFLPFP